MKGPGGNKTGETNDPIRESLEGKTLWKRFILSISLVIVLFVLGLFIGLMLRSNRLIHNEILSRARSNFDNIVLTRRWNANYGGVFVEKIEGMESNPYLENPDITTVDGKVYTKKNPALMTREISEYAESDGRFRFHITSLKPLNPNNKPDPFETEALKRFEEGKKEYMQTVPRDSKQLFRYMAPLMVEQSCMQCHAKQGYKVGDVRGGVSVTMDVTGTRRALKRQNVIIMVLSVISVMVVLGIIYFFIMRLNTRLNLAYRRIEYMAMMDELTGLYNRRYFFDRLQQEFSRAKRYGYALGCILLDLDHFKEVNDRYGHMAGDKVLAHIAAAVKEHCRDSDIVARYGGEEFVILLPEADREAAVGVAEKIRTVIGEQRIELDGGHRARITASLGAAGFTPEQLKDIDQHNVIIKLADSATYKAKDNGRNRVEAG
jgi:diguanylate cyclase (GGDEF)-like protein